MRIGVSGIGYQCGEHLAEVLQPWFDLRAQGQHEMLISLAYRIFPEVHAISQTKRETPDCSLTSLRGYLSQKMIDALFVSPEPKYEWNLGRALSRFWCVGRSTCCGCWICKTKYIPWRVCRIVSLPGAWPFRNICHGSEVRAT